MYSYTHGLESHIQATTDRRLAQALKSEQLRLARTGRPGRLALVTGSLRATIGAMLIAAGERLRQEPVKLPATTVLKRHVSRTA